MKNDAFISYSKTDKKTADAICKALEAAQLKCWYAPRNIPSGADWDASIMKALANSRVMVLVWSAQSDQSRQVKREVSIALDDVGITLIPFRVETIVASKLRYYLGNIQWLDAEASIEESLQHLVTQVKDAIHQATPPADVPEAELAGSAAIGEEEATQAAELAEAEAREREAVADRERAEAEAREREELEARELAEAARKLEEIEARERAEAEMREREELAARWRAEGEARKREEAEAREREEAAARHRVELAARKRAEAEALTAETLAGRVAAANSKAELKPFASSPPVPAQGTLPTYGALENRAVASSGVPAVDSYSPTALQKRGANRVAIVGVAIAAVALIAVVAGLTYAFWPSQQNQQLSPEVLASNATPTPESPSTSPYATVENVAGPSPAQPSPSLRKSSSPAISSTEGSAPTPEPTRPPATTTPGKAPFYVGDLTGKGIRMPQPAYPPRAKAAHASGAVDVEVTIDEYGNVISAKAISGHPLLQGAAVQAARASKFSPKTFAGQPVKVAGVIIYNFVEPTRGYPLEPPKD